MGLAVSEGFIFENAPGEGARVILPPGEVDRFVALVREKLPNLRVEDNDEQG